MHLHQQLAQIFILRFEVHDQFVLLLQQLVGQVRRSNANVVRRRSRVVDVALGQRVRRVSFTLKIDFDFQFFSRQKEDDTGDHDGDYLGRLRLGDRSAEQMNDIVAVLTDRLVDGGVQQQQQGDLVEQDVRQLAQEGRVLEVLGVAVESQFVVIVAIQVELEDQTDQTDGQVRKVDHRARTGRVKQRVVASGIDDVVEPECEDCVEELVGRAVRLERTVRSAEEPGTYQENGLNG